MENELKDIPITEEEKKKALKATSEILANLLPDLSPQVLYMACIFTSQTLKIGYSGIDVEKQKEGLRKFVEDYNEHIEVIYPEPQPKLDMPALETALRTLFNKLSANSEKRDDSNKTDAPEAKTPSDFDTLMN